MQTPQTISAHPFDRKVLGALLTGAALLGLILTFAYRTVAQVQLTSAQARAAQELSLQLNVVYETILNMETGQRGYLLTGSGDYRHPYEVSRRDLPAEVERLQGLMTRNPAQRANVAALAGMLAQRQAQMAHALELHRAQGVEAAMQFVRTNQGHETMRQIRGLLQRMSDEEQRILAERRVHEAATLRLNFWFSAALCGLVVALMMVIYALVRRETSTRASAAEQLERTNASLEERVRESTRELRAERQLLEERVRERTAQLAEASAVRARFLSAASHDLRQPLQTLMLLNATLREQRVNPLAARIVETQQQTLQSMSQLVHALLNINRLESGAVQPEIQDLDLGLMLGQLRSELTPLARTRRLDLEIDDCAAYVRSDPTLLREILQNLLSNAIRHTEHGNIRLRTHHDANHVLIEVTDTGPGIPEDKRELIFGEFQQLETPVDRRRDGFGLGLAIVRHAARALGLEVELESQVGIGTTFSLRVPLAATPSATSNTHANAPLESRTAAAGRVLLIDDEAGVRNATALFLRISGHEVVEAGSPAEALAALESGLEPDIVISDYHLGASLDGLQLVAQIRERLGAMLPAAILTGDTKGFARQSSGLDYCHIFHKPVDAQQLGDYVQSELAEAGAPCARDVAAPSQSLRSHG
jgi:signal transduction histidine kinase